jgi:predicted nuclease of predicted toxin-antitoxin system
MKMLLDENLPKKLQGEFDATHEVSTVADMGWQAKKNGELLGLMVIHGFEALVTMDKNLQYQQNIGKLPMKLIVLDAANHKLTTLRPLIPRLLQMIRQPSEDQVLMVQSER